MFVSTLQRTCVEDNGIRDDGLDNSSVSSEVSINLRLDFDSELSVMEVNEEFVSIN